MGSIWAGFGAIGLHNHTAEEECDDTCSVYVVGVATGGDD